MWRRCCCCCCKKETRQAEISERSSHPSEQELQGVIQDLQTAQTALEAEKARTAGLIVQKEEVVAEHPIYKATARELTTRLSELKAKEQDLLQLQDTNESLRMQVANLLELRSHEKSQQDDHSKRVTESRDTALSLRSQFEAITSKKRQAEKDSDRVKSRLESAQTALAKLKTRENEIARQTSKVAETSRTQIRRARLLTLQLIWSRVLLNSQLHAFHHWNRSKIH